MLARRLQGLDSAVDIFFKSTKLAKVLNEEARLRKTYGVVNARQIRLRLAVLEAATTLGDVPRLSPDRCHKLLGDRAGCFAVDAEHPFRIVFIPTAGVVPRRRDGGIDLRKVTSITILEITNYH